MAKAKETILDAARDLFNKSGSAAISTNHIAKHAKTSTGTLYYHYKNKEEIIKALYVQMGEEWLAFIGSLTTVTMQTLDLIKAFSEKLYHRYHFIHTELYALCLHDKTLAKLNEETLRERKIQVKILLLQLIEVEGFQPLDEEEMLFLVDAIWVFILYWQPYYEMQNIPLTTSPFDAVDRIIRRFLVKNAV